MISVFAKVINLSLIASIVILAVLVFRFFLKRFSHRAVCLLWVVVALRLVMPFSFESRFSLMPSHDIISVNEESGSLNNNTGVANEYDEKNPDMTTGHEDSNKSGIGKNNDAGIPSDLNGYTDSQDFENNPSNLSTTSDVTYTVDGNAEKDQSADQESNSDFVGNGSSNTASIEQADTQDSVLLEELLHSNEEQIISKETHKKSITNKINVWQIFAWVWLCGIIGMLLYMIISYLQTARYTRSLVTDSYMIDKLHVSICRQLESPFILGILRPVIYLPEGLTDEQKAGILAHEKTHLSRRDHIWKPFGFMLVCIYWFNPFVWLAYCLFCRDVEFACDEQVISNMNSEDIRSYSQTLLMCATHSGSGYPLAFGEIAVKDRIKAVLNYKKPVFWIIIAVLIICAVFVGVFMTKSPEDSNDKGNTNITSDAGWETDTTPDTGRETDITPNADQNDPKQTSISDTDKDESNAVSTDIVNSDHDLFPTTDSEHLLEGLNCYVSYCVDYLSPLSSALASDDTGEFYYFYGNKMVIGGKYDRTIHQTLDMISDGWEDYPNDTEKWLEQHAFGYSWSHRSVDTGFNFVCDSMENARILRYERNYCIIDLDHTLWLARFTNDPMDENSEVWSLHAIVPTSVEYFDRDRFSKMSAGEEITVGQTILTRHVPTPPESSLYDLRVFFLSPDELSDPETEYYDPYGHSIYSDNSFRVDALLDFIELNDSRNLCYAYERYNSGATIVGDSYGSALDKYGNTADMVSVGYRMLLSYIDTWPYVRLENDGISGSLVDELNQSDALALFPAGLRDKEGTGYELYISGNRLYLYKIEDSYARTTSFLYGNHGLRETFVASFSFENNFEPSMEIMRSCLFREIQWGEYASSLENSDYIGILEPGVYETEKGYRIDIDGDGHKDKIFVALCGLRRDTAEKYGWSQERPNTGFGSQAMTTIDYYYAPEYIWVNGTEYYGTYNGSGGNAEEYLFAITDIDKNDSMYEIMIDKSNLEWDECSFYEYHRDAGISLKYRNNVRQCFITRFDGNSGDDIMIDEDLLPGDGMMKLD